MTPERLRYLAWQRGYDYGYQKGRNDAIVTKGNELDALFEAALLMLNRGRKR